MIPGAKTSKNTTQQKQTSKDFRFWCDQTHSVKLLTSFGENTEEKIVNWKRDTILWSFYDTC